MRTFPIQTLPYSRKTKSWASDCVRFASEFTCITSSMIRKSVAHKKINYDLLSGELNMKDLEAIINPEGIDYGMGTPKIQHYPIMNSKIMLLLGEERASNFDFRVRVTNPEAVSDVEETKKNEILKSIQQTVEDESLSEEDYNKRIEQINRYYRYNWQDIREIRANCVLKHYYKQDNMPEMFNDGYVDAFAVNEEMYQCYIDHGEPCVRKLNPMKVHVYNSGYSNKVEDAGMIVIEDYYSASEIIDRYFDQLTVNNIKTIERYAGRMGTGDGRYEEDVRNRYIWGEQADALRLTDYVRDGEHGVWLSFADGITANQMPYDIAGNIRVLEVFWKSLRRIKKVKFYDEMTGDVDYKLETEDYVVDKEAGEEAKIMFVNEAWQGTMIGAGEDAIFVDCRPCPVQRNSLSNPSKCDFGIIGTIYNFNDSKPYSMIDMMKVYNYHYDAIHYRLDKLIANNWGKIIQLNASMVPEGWDIDKWLYYAKANGLAVVDPMNEGTTPIAKGHMAGMFNMSSVIDAEMGNSIQQMINMLEYIKVEIGEIVGITAQRQGQVANRETANGIERSVLQSSHTTRWYSAKHDDVKARVLSCFLDYAKIAMRGKSKKFEYVLPDLGKIFIDVPGDEFAECEYGLVVDSGFDMQAERQEIGQVAMALAQNQKMFLSTYLKIKRNTSIGESIRMLEDDERNAMEQQQQQFEQQQKTALQQSQMQAEVQRQKNELERENNIRDNETKIVVEQIKAATAKYQKDDSDGDGIVENADKEKLAENIRQFNAKLDADYEKMALQKQMNDDNIKSRERIAKMNARKRNTDKQ